MSKLLNRIDSPADLKGLTHQELKQLAAEIRQELISRVMANGVHLASNLGVFELIQEGLNAEDDNQGHRS